MLSLSRVCIPITRACNLECVYCYRQLNTDRIERLTDHMAEYIRQLDPKMTKAITITGGEPLLCFDRVKEILDLVPAGIHKKIATNGILLTQEIIDWVNREDIEIMTSWDGPVSDQTRGFDILADEKTLNLLKQVKTLRINMVVTAGMEDLVDAYCILIEFLERRDFLFTYMPIYDEDNPKLTPFTKDVDIDKYVKSVNELSKIAPRCWAYNSRHKEETYGFNVLPNGDVVDMHSLLKVGTIDDDKDTILARAKELGLFDRCLNRNCRVRPKCKMVQQNATDFNCKVQAKRIFWAESLKNATDVFL